MNGIWIAISKLNLCIGLTKLYNIAAFVTLGSPAAIIEIKMLYITPTHTLNYPVTILHILFIFSKCLVLCRYSITCMSLG